MSDQANHEFHVLVPEDARHRYQRAQMKANGRARELIEKCGWNSARVTLLHPETLAVVETPQGQRLECYHFEIARGGDAR